jgi:iron complex transport system substrate-binding protein
VCAVRYESVLDLVRSRSELRGTRVLALNPQSLDEVLTDIGRFARAAEAANAGQHLQQLRQARLDVIGNRTIRLAEHERPRVVCIEWVLPLMAAGNWTPRLIELAGGQSGLAKPGEHSDYITFEQLRQFDPDVLLVAPCGFDLARSQWEARLLPSLPGFGELAAVRSGRAFVIDGNAYLNRSGPRLVESLEIVAHLLHPKLFEPPALVDAWRPLL